MPHRAFDAPTGRARFWTPELAGEGLPPATAVDAPAADDPLHRIAQAVGDPPRVLIVDDDADFLAIAEASLRVRGFQVERASGGLRGVFLATQEVPDAIVCDLRMPGIDGFVVAEALRADPATARTAIVACTGRKDLEARAIVRSSAFDAVLVKPVDWEDVAGLLTETIARRRAAPE
jgi:CheY-like chemotaxis protein